MDATFEERYLDLSAARGGAAPAAAARERRGARRRLLRPVAHRPLRSRQLAAVGPPVRAVHRRRLRSRRGLYERRGAREGGCAISTLTASLPARRADVRFVGLIAGLPILLGIAQFLPHTGVGLAVRLAAAAGCVLLVPGALIMRLTGWPRELGVAVGASVGWSLAAVFVCLLLTFAFAGSLTLTLVLLTFLVFGTAIPVAVRRVAEVEQRDVIVVGVLALVGVAFAVAVWLATGPVSGDGLFHLARVRKLLDFPGLSLNAVNEFKHGGLHPGYAFPLWHATLGLITQARGRGPGSDRAQRLGASRAARVRHVATRPAARSSARRGAGSPVSSRSSPSSGSRRSTRARCAPSRSRESQRGRSSCPRSSPSSSPTCATGRSRCSVRWGQARSRWRSSIRPTRSSSAFRSSGS